MRYPEFLITESEKNKILKKYNPIIKESATQCPLSIEVLLNLGQYTDKTKQYKYCKFEDNGKLTISKYDETDYIWAFYEKNAAGKWVVSYTKTKKDTPYDFDVENVKLSDKFSKVLDSAISGTQLPQQTTPTQNNLNNKKQPKSSRSKRGTIEYDN
jgi:hypothetical protein